MQNFSLHTHTIGFDGRNTVAEMIAAARDNKMSVIGISNHYMVHPFAYRSNMYRYAKIAGYDTIYATDFDTAQKRFEPHFAEIRDQARENRDIRVLRGMEVDFFQYPGWRAGFEQAIEKLQPDYIIGSTHFIERDSDLYNMNDLKLRNIPGDELNTYLKQYWKNVAMAAKSGLFNIIAHIDLPKKVWLAREKSWHRMEEDALKAIADSGCVMEINTSSYMKMNEPYPSERIMKTAVKMNIPLILSDDAHRATQVGNFFDTAESWARKCGAQRFVGYQKVLDFSQQRR